MLSPVDTQVSGNLSNKQTETQLAVQIQVPLQVAAIAKSVSLTLLDDNQLAEAILSLPF